MKACDRIEKLLWAVSLVSIGFVLFFAMRGLEYRALSAELMARPQPSESPHAAQALRQAQSQAIVNRNILGRIEIPSLHLAAAVMSDYDPTSLREGVGHIRGTALPGGLGTVGLAGHRDTFFRPLRKIGPNMQIRLIGKTGTYSYSVDSTEIVTPDRVNVLNIGSRPELTLITCYPFDYIGAAPNRFIVHAHLLSVSPEPLESSRH
ncbi:MULTISPECIES: class D sortase [Acidobacteriaceae]|uniref:class D sortase n=1 Tax=Acidobacteriaceae TaxID=204434 RepID=UPI00131CC25E|nr:MULTISPECIES: class D sortase [Acidobacteriaceae]MDW5267621.1 class D sortase [Edaphobacter sp.]